ncbi:hypothetical protein [uncultured Cetobacterium sp.]|uniref:hypothetical protein n=1 Tax=uncultured Cetobacterium sp. TaxID=527638 RepID=UPI00260AFEC3|nr:hypothetical protein [uncultured Cetobacterium sp.]
MKNIFTLLACLTIVGCTSNPYKNSYTTDKNTQKIQSINNTLVTPIGESQFQGKNNINKNDSIQFAKEIDADIILLNKKYSHTETKTITKIIPVRSYSATSLYEYENFDFHIDKYLYTAKYFKK